MASMCWPKTCTRLIGFNSKIWPYTKHCDQEICFIEKQRVVKNPVILETLQGLQKPSML